METKVWNPLQLILRPAEKTDLFLFYNWANDPDVRKASFTTNQISLIEHENWFFNKLEDQHSKILIGTTDDCPVGMVRFDIRNNEAVISYLVDRHFRGSGYGLLLLKEGIQYIKDTYGESFSITGFIKDDNLASVKTFEKAGFISDLQAKKIYENASKYILDWEKFNMYIQVLNLN